MTAKQALNQIEAFIMHELLSLSIKEYEACKDHSYQQAQSFLDQQAGLCKVLDEVMGIRVMKLREEVES